MSEDESQSEHTKHPWMKFFPSNHRSDPSLRVCSMAARGLWMEMLCLMHEAEPRGSLVVAGKQITKAQLAAFAGAPQTLTSKLLTELEEANVFSRDPDGMIFSRRMRRDTARAHQNKINGGRGGNPSLNRSVNPADKTSDNPRDKAKKIEVRKSEPHKGARRAPEERGSALARLKAVYPSNAVWLEDAVRRALDKSIKQGGAIEDIVAAAKHFDEECKAKGRNHPPAAHTWLEGGGWKELKPSSDAAAGRQSFVDVDDQLWPLLAARWRREKQTPLPRRESGPKRKNGWDFPAKWIEDLRRSAA